MIPYELSSINVHQIQIFLSIAKTASLTKSAQIFNMTQPGISKGISKLENSLGFPLFIRTNRLIALTPAGKTLYHEWRQILDSLEHGFHSARAVHHHPFDILTISIPFSVNSNKAIKPYANAWKEQYPQCTIHVVEESLQNFVPCIISNKFHLGIIPCALAHFLDSDTLSWRSIDYSCMQVILATSHHLASYQQISLCDLAPYPHVIYAPTPDAYNDEYLTNILSPVGISPNVEGRGKSNYEIQDLLINTQRILLVDSYFRYATEMNDCVAIPVSDCQSSLLCVWKKGIVSTAVENFINLVDQLCAEPNPGT